MNSSRKTRKLRRVKNNKRLARLKAQQPVVVTLAPVFVLVIIKLALPYGNPLALLMRLRHHIDKLTGNADFPTTTPTIAQLTSKADALETTIIAITAGNKALIPHRKTLVKEGLEMIRQLSYDIQFQSGGDEEKIKGAGFEVRKIGGAAQEPGQILNLRTKPVGEGKIRLRWVKDDNTKVYGIQQLVSSGPTPIGQWEDVGTTRNVTFLVKNLNPGQLYTFRVYGTNGNDQGNPSDPAEQRSL